MPEKNKRAKPAPPLEETRTVASGAMTPLPDEELTAFELVNKYGTYEIQPTQNTDNVFPAIGTGFPKGEAAEHYTTEADKAAEHVRDQLMGP